MPYQTKSSTGQGTPKNLAVHAMEKPEPDVVGYMQNVNVTSIQGPRSFASVASHLNW